MAQEIGNNNLIDTWASGGSIVEPDLTKKNTGWTLGEKPPHEFMNYLQNEFGKQVNYLLRSGVAAHNVATAYLTGDMVTSGVSVWIALANNTNSVPSLGNTNWRRMITADDIPDASETVKGLIEHATQAETDGGTAGNLAVTPVKLRFGFASSLGANGYIRLPSWLSGFTIQWGSASESSSIVDYKLFPIPFENACWAMSATANAPLSPSTWVTINNASRFLIGAGPDYTAGGINFYWIAIGH